MVTENFPSRFESLAGIRDFVNLAAKDAGFNEKEIYAVELAVDEACANIIEPVVEDEPLREGVTGVGVNVRDLVLVDGSGGVDRDRGPARQHQDRGGDQEDAGHV